MIINHIALQRPKAVIVLVAFIILAGLFSYAVLPRESAPDISIPYVFVTTTYEGVAPADMETLITIPLERKLKGISGLEEIKSSSEDGISTISIKFAPGIHIDDAVPKVREKVDQALPDLPPDLPDDPVILEANFSDIPILQVVLSGPFSLKRLKRFAEEFEDRFESIPGVLDVKIVGGLEREIHVEFDLERIAFYNVPVSEAINAVRQGNVNMPGGSMDIGQAKYLVRVPEDYRTPDAINAIVAYVRDGKPVYLRDVAEIRDHYKDPVTRSRIDGNNSVTLQVVKRSGENIIRINDEVARIVQELTPQYPPTLAIDLTADQARDIRNMVADLENNILSGLLLVLVVVFVFIGGRSAFFVSLSIPLSMLITFIILNASGITLNMVVLFSLTLVLGMLVDNAIVVIENIYRHIQEGMGRLEAARAATDEVAWPVIASTLTTVGAFAPMLYWPGIMGEFMRYLPLTVIFGLSGSLLVALVVNPVLSSRFQTAKPARQGVEALPRLLLAYRGLLRLALRNRLKVVGLALALLVVSIVAYGRYGKGVEFFPEVEPNRANVFVKAPVGANLDTSDALVQEVEKITAQYPDIRHVIANVGAAGGDPFSAGGTGTHLSTVVLDFKEPIERTRRSSEIIKELRTRLKASITGAEVRVEQEENGPPTGPPINMEITGKDVHVLGELAAEVRRRIVDIPGLVDLKDNYVQGKPEITVTVDKEKAALLGLDTYTVAYTIKTAVNGAKIGVFREGKDEYDIIARLPAKDRQSVEAVRRLTVSGPGGAPVPLTSLAEINLSSGLGGINRIDQKRVITVSANVSGVLANDVIAEIGRRIADMTWPRGYAYAFTGEQQEQEKSQDFLGKAFVAALFIIFMILILQFDSWSAPLIILFTVLLSLIGVFFGLLATGTAFGVIMTGLGVISLAGVVVNNAIVLIDYYRLQREKGLECDAALVQTGLTRFRPVMLTAITTILGLIPMATGVSFDFIHLRWDIGGESSQWWGPMAVAVSFGLAVATLLTLVVVPVLCSLAEGWGEVRLFRWKRDRARARTR